MLCASALNVVASTFMPAIPGTMMSRSFWLPARLPITTRKMIGITMLKTAAAGLRQNMARSRRYWRHASAESDTDDILGLLVGQLEVDVLQRRARDRQLVDLLAALYRRAGQLV